MFFEEPRKYIVKEYLNCRVEPFSQARIVNVLEPGTIVQATALVDDWLYMAENAGYIRFGCGLYCEALAKG